MLQGNIAYLFPGQGSQYVGMGKDIYDGFPSCRQIFQSANEALGFDITRLCFEGPIDELSKTPNTQPAILTVSIATLKALEPCRINFKPKATAGLSVGEYSALVAAGSIDFRDAVRLIRARGVFMEQCSRENPGSMAAIMGLERGKLEVILRETEVEIANLNCPGQIVVSGRTEDILKAIDLAARAGAKKSVILKVSGPFHSSLMDSASQRLKKELEKAEISSPQIPVISNLTANYVKTREEIINCLTDQVNHPVRWEDSMRLAIKDGIAAFLEIGPGKVLKGLLRRIDPTLKVYDIETAEDIESIREKVFCL